MDEYFGTSAQKYKQPPDKFFSLFPALERLIPSAKENQTLLDLACGTGDLFEFIIDKGYEYTGIDLSEDMLAQAKAKHPAGVFLHGNATDVTTIPDEKFSVVLCNMLMPSIEDEADFNSVFKVVSEVVSENGLVVVSSGHPCFDGYMGKKFFAREDIRTEYAGYFKSGAPYTVQRKFDSSDFEFNDFHWTLTDYLIAAEAAGLQLVAIDECPLMSGAPPEIVQKFERKGTPSFIVFAFKTMLLP